MRWKIAQWFEVRWWRRYLGDKDPTAYLGWKATYWRDFLSQIDLQPGAGATVLDAGCGPAGIHMILKEQVVTAIDPLLDHYVQEVSFFSADRYPWVTFEQMMIEALENPQGFDHIFCLNVINHVENIDAAYNALIASLKPGRTLIISIDCHRFSLVKLLFRAIPFDILHPHQFDVEEYREALSKRGLKIERSVRLKKGTLFDYYALVATKA